MGKNYYNEVNFAFEKSTAICCIVVLYLKFEKVTRWGCRHPFGHGKKESLQICTNINLEALTILGLQNSLWGAK